MSQSRWQRVSCPTGPAFTLSPQQNVKISAFILFLLIMNIVNSIDDSQAVEDFIRPSLDDVSVEFKL